MSFFFKQKTAYEVRISDWSSDVCSSDLLAVLDDGVLAWLADDPGDGRPNAGLVVDADAATAIDTLCVPSQTGAFAAAIDELGQIGRASCRERVCQYV